jgi:hypothetical protein
MIGVPRRWPADIYAPRGSVIGRYYQAWVSPLESIPRMIAAALSAFSAFK